jgi:hypothetical protein
MPAIAIGGECRGHSTLQKRNGPFDVSSNPTEDAY